MDIYGPLRAIATKPTPGVRAGTGVSVEEFGNDAIQYTILTFKNTPIPMVDEAGVVAFGSLKIYDMPEGFIQFLGAVADLDLTKSSAGINLDWDGDVGVGTTAAGNNNALATTEQNIIPTTATPQAVASVTTANAASTITEAGLVVDGHTTPVDVFLNLLVDDADHDTTTTPCNIIVNGTIKLRWANLGDF